MSCSPASDAMRRSAGSFAGGGWGERGTFFLTISWTLLTIGIAVWLHLIWCCWKKFVSNLSNNIKFCKNSHLIKFSESNSPDFRPWFKIGKPGSWCRGIVCTPRWRGHLSCPSPACWPSRRDGPSRRWWHRHRWWHCLRRNAYVNTN